jgi:hypothetical protein
MSLVPLGANEIRWYRYLDADLRFGTGYTCGAPINLSDQEP